MPRKHTEAEAIAARERRILRQRLYQKRRRELNPGDHNSFWTVESQRWLVNLFQQNLPTAEIGRRMGVTKNTIIGRLHRCGLSGGYCGLTTMDRLKAWNEAWAARNGREDKFPEGEVAQIKHSEPRGVR